MIPSWMPVVKALVHPTPLRQDRSPNPYDRSVAPMQELIMLPQLVVQVLT